MIIGSRIEGLMQKRDIQQIIVVRSGGSEEYFILIHLFIYLSTFFLCVCWVGGFKRSCSSTGTHKRITSII